MAIISRRLAFAQLVAGMGVLGAKDAWADVVQYTYDERGRIKTVTYSDGRSITYTYDAAGNRSQLIQTLLPSVTLTASPISIANGSSATLSWTTGNATSASIDSGVGALAPVAGGSRTVSPSATTTYTLTATGPGGTASTTAEITVYPNPTATLTANPNPVPQGSSTTLNWTTTNATGASIDQGIGAVTPAAGGSVVVSPLVTTTYTLTATGPGGTTTTTRTVTVTPSGFVQTINVTGTGPVNLRSLADAAGYTGTQNATVIFVVGSSITLTGTSASTITVDSGVWPTGSYDIDLTLSVSGKVRGGGGKAGNAGSGYGAGAAGAAGGDALYCRLPMTVVVDSGGFIQAGGGGGAGGKGGVQFVSGEPRFHGGGGGGGGQPNGPGGTGGVGEDGGLSGQPGTAGTPTVAGAGGPPGALQAQAGGSGGAYGIAGAGLSGGAAGGVAGYAIRKNGHVVNVTNNGTITGAQE